MSALRPHGATLPNRTLIVSRDEFLGLVEAGMIESELGHDSRLKLRKVAWTAELVSTGSFNRMNPEDGTMCGCPAIQADLRWRVGTTAFGIAFDQAADVLALKAGMAWRPHFVAVAS